MITPTRPAGRRSRRAARAGVVLGTLACSFAVATAAQAVGTDASFEINVFPADYAWDGVSQPAPRNTGSYYGFFRPDRDSDMFDPATRLEQVRGGVVVDALGVDAPYSDVPVAVSVGDVFRVVRTTDGAVLAQTTFVGQPTITSSVLGQTLFAGSTSPDATERSVDLVRRVARTRTGHEQVQPTYRWVDTTPRPDGAPLYDESAYTGGTIPEEPASPEPDHYWVLTVDQPGHTETTTTNSNDPEVVSAGRLSTVAPTTFAGAFDTPIVAGDWLRVEQTTRTLAGGNRMNVNVSVVGAAGVVPPPPVRDTAPPKVATFTLGAPSTTVASFLKHGLYTFATLDEPVTVAQQLQVFVKPAKKPAKKTKAPKGEKKGTKRAAAPIATKAKLVVVGAGTGTTAVGGGTARTVVKAVKGAKAAFAKTGSSVVRANLVSTIKDAAGNVTTTNTPVKLTGNAVAKATKAKHGKKRGKGHKAKKGTAGK